MKSNRNRGRRTGVDEMTGKSNGWGNPAIKHYTEQYDKQEGRCAVCGEGLERNNTSWLTTLGQTIAKDHNHAYGQNDPRGWRGILCGQCNTNVGMLEVALNDAERILNYLSQWNSL